MLTKYVLACLHESCLLGVKAQRRWEMLIIVGAFLLQQSANHLYLTSQVIFEKC